MVKYKITAIAAPNPGNAACTWKNTVRGAGAADTHARQLQHNQEEYKHEARHRKIYSWFCNSINLHKP